MRSAWRSTSVASSGSSHNVGSPLARVITNTTDTVNQMVSSARPMRPAR